MPIFNQNNTSNGVVYIISRFIKDKSDFDIKSGKQSDELGNIWGAYDNGLHDSYLVLSAKNHNVDTLIMGIRDDKKIRTYFTVPDDEIITSVIAFGFNDDYHLKTKRKTVDEILKVK